MDRQSFLTDLSQRKDQVLTQEQKLLVEVSLFLGRYSQSKEYLEAGYCLDAYSQILEALHHWARLAILEEGYQPELAVWRQVHAVNPGIYKLYEELILNSETIAKRVELVTLACEFSVMSKMSLYSRLLLRIIASRHEPWSEDELRNHADLQGVRFNLQLVLNKLVAKSLLQEVTVSLGSTLGETGFILKI